MKQIASLIILTIGIHMANAQQISKSFEIRHFSNDNRTNGQTDFTGGDEWMDTEERITFLNDYAAYGKQFYQVPGLDKMPVTEEEADLLLKKIKPQPQPEVRQRIHLTSCKWIGYHEGLTIQKEKSMSSWQLRKGVKIAGGELVFEKKTFASVPFNGELSRYYKWRYHLSWEVKPGATISETRFVLEKGGAPVIEAGITPEGKCFFTSNGNQVEKEYLFRANETYRFKLEVDHESKKYNLLVNDLLVADFTGLNSDETPDGFTIHAAKGTSIDNIWGLGFDNAVTDEDFPGISRQWKGKYEILPDYL